MVRMTHLALRLTAHRSTRSQSLVSQVHHCDGFATLYINLRWLIYVWPSGTKQEMLLAEKRSELGSQEKARAITTGQDGRTTGRRQLHANEVDRLRNMQTAKSPL